MRRVCQAGILCICLFFLTQKLFSAAAIATPSNVELPSLRSFNRNTDFMKTLHHKKLTPAEYVTDPLILYATLWGCLGTTIPLWENPSASIIPNGDTFADRMKMEPFVQERSYQIFKPIVGPDGVEATDNNGNILLTFTGDIVAKNILEPTFFIYMTLYLRAKNYHPALVIGQIFAFSFLYEFTVRPFFIRASFEQLLKNPAIGCLFGIFLDEISSFLLTTPYLGLHVLAYILNPFKALPTSRIRPLLIFKPFRQAVSLEAVIELDVPESQKKQRKKRKF